MAVVLARPIGYSSALSLGYGRQAVLGSWVSKAFESVVDAAQNTWEHVQDEVKRVGGKIEDDFERSFKRMSGRGWWQDLLLTDPITFATDQIIFDVNRSMQRVGFDWPGDLAETADDWGDSAWQHTWDEAKRLGYRVSDELTRATHNLGSRDWWVNTVARTISRDAALRLMTAIVSFVFPPVAIVVTSIEAFLAKYKADFVATPEFWSVAQKDETNAFLAEVVTEVNKLDLFNTLPTLALTELAIQAQDSRKKRDKLRMEIFEIQQKWANTKWAVIAKAVFETAQAVAVTVVTFGAGSLVIAAIEAARLAISAATTLLQMQMMREIMKIAKDETKRRQTEFEARMREETRVMREEIARLEAEIAALGAAPVSETEAVAQEQIAATQESVGSFLIAGAAVGLLALIATSVRKAA